MGGFFDPRRSCDRRLRFCANCRCGKLCFGEVEGEDRRFYNGRSLIQDSSLPIVFAPFHDDHHVGYSTKSRHSILFYSRMLQMTVPPFRLADPCQRSDDVVRAIMLARRLTSSRLAVLLLKRFVSVKPSLACERVGCVGPPHPSVDGDGRLWAGDLAREDHVTGDSVFEPTVDAGNCALGKLKERTGGSITEGQSSSSSFELREELNWFGLKVSRPVGIRSPRPRKPPPRR